jgi:tetratricopeptide (TPR) repeat protein
MSEASPLPPGSQAPPKAPAELEIKAGGISGTAKVVLGVLGLLLLTQLAYWPLHTAGYIWDDGGWLVHNHFVHHWRGLWNIWFAPRDSIQYYPLVFTAFVFQWHIWGASAFGYHLTNIFLQGIDAIFLWRVLKALNLRSAWIAAAIWAIHPVQVETVGWVAEQKNLLSALFLFPAILIWIGVGDLPGKRLPGSGFLTAREWPHYLLASGCFLLALLAKTDVCLIPIVLLFVLWWKRGWIHDRDVRLLAPWMILGVISALTTIYLEHTQVGAHGQEFHFTLAQHLIIAGKDLWFYPLKLFWPWPMMAVYPRWHISHPAAWEWIFPIAGFGVPLVLLALSKKIGRGPFVAVCVYGLMIAPVLGFIAFYTEVYTFVADHYQYIACIGVIVLITEGITHLLSHMAAQSDTSDAPARLAADQPPAAPAAGTAVNRATPAWTGLALSALVLLALGTMTWAQSEVYTPPLHVWTHNVRYNPDGWLAIERIGAHEYEKGRIATALVLFQRANALSHGENLIVNSNIGDVYRHLGQYARAIPYYRRSLAAARHQPPIISHLVQCYEKTGQWRHAYAQLVRGVKLLPHSADLQKQLADLLARSGHPKMAIPHYLIAVKYEPKNTQALFALAQTLDGMGQWKKAIPYYQRAIAASPEFGHGHFAYGLCLLQHGRPAAAAREFQTVLQLGRRLRLRHHALGRHYAPELWRIETHQVLAQALRALHHPKQAARQESKAAALIKRRKQWAARHGQAPATADHAGAAPSAARN